jgi:hypothetical protein
MIGSDCQALCREWRRASRRRGDIAVRPLPVKRQPLSPSEDKPLPARTLPSPHRKTALSLGERVSRDGAFSSRRGTGEGSLLSVAERANSKGKRQMAKFK